MIASKSAETKARIAPVQFALGWEGSINEFLGRHSTVILRGSLALVFCWFGALKLIPGLSPAEHLAGQTLQVLSLGFVKPAIGLPLLGIAEVALGIAVLLWARAKYTIPLLLLHLAGTVTPMLLFPHETFAQFPIPTLVGQYILKNVVLVAAALAILGAPDEGGRIGHPTSRGTGSEGIPATGNIS
jgi:hypothetical protein